MVVSIKVLGVAQTAAFINNTSKEVFNAANKAIAQAGLFIEGEVKESIAGQRAEPRSVDTGRFLSSVKSTQDKPLQAKIETNVEYADTLEYGTSKRQPRPHFRNTAKRNETKVKDFVQVAIKKAT